MANPNRYRCPACRTRRTDWLTLVAHCASAGHRVCNCGGYHYAHRPGSPYCTLNVWSDLRHAARAGESGDVLLDLAVDIAFENPGQAAVDCPF